MAGWTTEVHKDVRVLREIGEWWDKQPAVQSNPFLNSKVLACWQNGIGDPSSTFRLHLVRRRRSLVAGAALYAARGRHRSAYRGMVEPFDVVVSPDVDAVGLLDAWLDCVPYVRFYRVPADSPLVEIARNHPRRVLSRPLVRPFIDLSMGSDALVDRLSSNKRRSLRRHRRRLGELGELRFVGHHGGSGLAQALERGFDLEMRGWKGSKGRAVRHNTAFYRWYRAMAEVAEHEGWLRVSALYLDDRMLAFNTGLHFNNIDFGMTMSYDESPDVKPYSPGSLLLQSVIDYDGTLGISRVELGTGRDRWKTSWADGHTYGYDLTSFGSDLRGKVLNFLSAARRRVRE